MGIFFDIISGDRTRRRAGVAGGGVHCVGWGGFEGNYVKKFGALLLIVMNTKYGVVNNHKTEPEKKNNT